jgi:hypothetical protein
MANKGIRAIDKGTRYDIIGNLIRLALGFGTSSVPELAMTADLMKKRITRGD